MEPLGLAVLAGAFALVAGAAWWRRTRDGVLRPATGGGDAPGDGSGDRAGHGASGGASGGSRDRSTVAVLERLGVRPGDAELTVVQFSTAFCAPCRATRTRLQHLQASRPGLAHVDIDAEAHLDEVRELDVRRTPTLFYLRSDGTLLGRSSGAPRPDELTALVTAHTGVANPGADRAGATPAEERR